jgi:cytochrome c biogenesis factor
LCSLADDVLANNKRMMKCILVGVVTCLVFTIVFVMLPIKYPHIVADSAWFDIQLGDRYFVVPRFPLWLLPTGATLAFAVGFYLTFLARQR